MCHPSHTLHIPTLPSLTTQPHPTYAFKAPALPSLSMICTPTHACMQHWNTTTHLMIFCLTIPQMSEKCIQQWMGIACNPMTTAKSLADSTIPQFWETLMSYLCSPLPPSISASLSKSDPTDHRHLEDRLLRGSWGQPSQWEVCPQNIWISSTICNRYTSIPEMPLCASGCISLPVCVYIL